MEGASWGWAHTSAWTVSLDFWGVPDVVQVLVREHEPPELSELHALLREQPTEGVGLARQARVHEQGACGVCEQDWVHRDPGPAKRPLEL
jgi:hypothetical protein